MEIKELSDNIRKNGFDYTCISRGIKSFVFSQAYTPNLAYYEVFKRRVSKECIFHGKVIPERIAFPGNEDFGDWAWTFKSKEKAMQKFRELEAVE